MENYLDAHLILLAAKAFTYPTIKKDPNRNSKSMKKHSKWMRAKGVNNLR